jgi:CubicO group peptidase (beta-lactamase class C family)
MNRLFFLVVLGIVSLLISSCDEDENLPDPVDSAYYYPPLSGTAWETVNPRDLGWNESKLGELINYVESNNSSAFIILYKGKIVTETYWKGFGINSSERIFSASKSIAGFLSGLAAEQGKIDLDKKVSDYIGIGWSNSAAFRENQITVRHLISMTSGLAEDLTYEVPPGTKWYYNTIAYHKVYEVLAAGFGQSNAQYTSEQLWKKIGMQDSYWDTEPGGGPSMSCSGRDMARFGLMILSEGKWNETTMMKNSTYFNSMLESSQNLNPSYGYLWWLNGKSSFMLPGTSVEVFPGTLVANAPADMVSALGFGDKKIYVVPSEDLVVIRHGAPSNAPVSYALSNFDNEIWKRLMATINQ